MKEMVTNDSNTEHHLQPLTLSPREFARTLGVGRDSTYRAIRAGKIKVIKPGRAIRIPRTELERVLREGLE